MMIISRIICVPVAALATLLNACAASVRPEISSLLIKQGEPSVSYDAPDAGKGKAAKPTRADYRLPADRPARERTESANTVENTDKPLSQALKGLRLADTASNRLRVAGEYRRLKILDKAYEHATAALKINRRSAEALEQRAQVWREWGFPHFGLGDAHRAVFIAPGSPSARNTLGTLLQSMGQPESARQAYQYAVRLDPRAAYAWSNLCYLSLVSGNHERAISECDTALQLAPELHAARNNMALSYATAGRLEEARDELFAKGSRADAAFNLGMLYLALGKYQLAEESFRHATDIRPSFSAAESRRRQAARLAAATSNSYDYSNRP
jgi:tetratricopeptide (TPR) repeat protein